MAKSKIEWTDTTWNPVIGCCKISAGCKFCYAEKMAKRLQAMYEADNTKAPQYKDGFKLNLVPTALQDPTRWRKPRMVFVCSMSDLFHKDVPDDYIKQVFDVMAKCKTHTFQVLTKRIERAAKLAPTLNWSGKNVWMGTSVENNTFALKRIPQLKKITQAKYRFVSIEPLIGPVISVQLLAGLDWVIVGGESGATKARPIEKGWVEVIRKACEHFKIAFFFKQWGKVAFNPDPTDPTLKAKHQYSAKGGCGLDGKAYLSMPGKKKTIIKL